MACDARQVKLAPWREHACTNLWYLPFLNCSVDRERWPWKTSRAVRSNVCAFLCGAWMTPSEERNHYVTWKIVLFNNLNTHSKKDVSQPTASAWKMRFIRLVRPPICQILLSITPCDGVGLTLCVVMTQLTGRGWAGQGKLYYQHLLRNWAIFTTPGLIQCLLCLTNTKHCNTQLTRKGLDWQLNCLIKIELPEG